MFTFLEAINWQLLHIQQEAVWVLFEEGFEYPPHTSTFVQSWWQHRSCHNQEVRSTPGFPHLCSYNLSSPSVVMIAWAPGKRELLEEVWRMRWSLGRETQQEQRHHIPMRFHLKCFWNFLHVNCTHVMFMSGWSEWNRRLSRARRS